MLKKKQISREKFWALYEYMEAEHDYEETILTMKHVTRRYSPWNSKIYGLRELPTKK